MATQTWSGNKQTQDALPYEVLIAARERVRLVLEPHLGHQHALERANNIAQALTFNDEEPAFVAREMLRHMPSEQRALLADAVQKAFHAHGEGLPGTLGGRSVTSVGAPA